MGLGFKLKDVMHRISAKFYLSSLPDARKPYILRAVHQPELDIHAVASKAELYNVPTDPQVIEEGLTNGLALITYLAADGYKIKTPVFSLKASIPGEYDGTETHLPDGIHPQGRLLMAPELRRYLRERVEIQILGIEDTNGIIGEIINSETGEVNETITPGRRFDIHGTGLKIAADLEHAADTGIFLESVDTGTRIRIAPYCTGINEPRTLNAFAPDASVLPPQSKWYVVVRTQLSAMNRSTLLQNVREVKADFIITIHDNSTGL